MGACVRVRATVLENSSDCTAVFLGQDTPVEEIFNLKNLVM